jgi:hypothetical protein
MSGTARIGADAATDMWPPSCITVRVPVSGDSMAPLIADADAVRVRAGASPRVGDVVVAHVGNGLIVHRCARRRCDGVQLRGDNVPTADPVLPVSAVLGRVVAIESGRAPWRRLDGPWARATGSLTAAYGRAQARSGRGPRPKHVAAASLWVATAVHGRRSAEASFVLLAARSDVLPSAAARARELTSTGLDWERVVRLARLGQLGPRLYVGLRQVGIEGGVPVAVTDRLRSMYAGGWARARRSAALMTRVVALLADAGIPVMAHKGAALAAIVYRDPALQVGGDIDLSVPDADLALAAAVTREVREPLAADNPDRRDPAGFHIELDGLAHHDLDPSRHGGGHWRCGPLDWPAIWASAGTVDVGGWPMRVPSPSDLVVTLIANAVRRGFTPVRLVSDLAETVIRHTDGIDWTHVATALAAARLDRRSWIALDLAADWFDAPVPAALLEPPADLRLAPHERWILEHKRRQPFWRVPSRVLWAGSTARAVAVAGRLGFAAMRRTRSAG